MNKQLPLVNTFNPPLEIWSQRNMTNDTLLAKIDTPYKAVVFYPKSQDNLKKNLIPLKN